MHSHICPPHNKEIYMASPVLFCCVSQTLSVSRCGLSVQLEWLGEKQPIFFCVCLSVCVHNKEYMHVPAWGQMPKPMYGGEVTALPVCLYLHLEAGDFCILRLACLWSLRTSLVSAHHLTVKHQHRVLCYYTQCGVGLEPFKSGPQSCTADIFCTKLSP